MTGPCHDERRGLSAGGADARKFETVFQVSVTQALKHLFVRINDAEFEWLHFFTARADDVMMVMAALAVHDLIMSHVFIEVAFLNKAEFNENGKRAVNRDRIATVNLLQKLLEIGRREWFLLFQNGFKQNLSWARQSISRFFNSRESDIKSEFCVAIFFSWLHRRPLFLFNRFSVSEMDQHNAHFDGCEDAQE
jgi:hypothetical protein